MGLVTPSSSIAPFPRRTARAVRALAGLGFRPLFGPHATWHPERKPSPAALAADIAWCCEHPDVDVILCTTGGKTSVEILDDVDYRLLAASRKVLCGFSDITALLLAVYARTGLVTCHGPTLLPSFGDADGVDPYTSMSLLDTLSPGVPTAGRVLAPPARSSTDAPWWDRDDDRPRERSAATGWWALAPGVARGRLVGGHVRTMASLLGTPYLPDTDGALVFLETNAPHVDEVAADLGRLEAGGVFDRAAGLVFGRPLVVDRPDALYRAFARLALDRRLPALADVDLGHTVPLLSLPIGVTATIDAEAGLLRVDEPAVAAREPAQRSTVMTTMSLGTPPSRSL